MRGPTECVRLQVEAIEALEALILSLRPSDPLGVTFAPIERVANARAAVALLREHIENCERCEEP